VVVDGCLRRSQAELDGILDEHRKWVETNKKVEKRADLSNAILNRAHLLSASLIGTHLPGAILDKADLSKANLSEIPGAPDTHLHGCIDLKLTTHNRRCRGPLITLELLDEMD
jgi:hypothetical protein